ncbi:MAG: Zn-dependent exopeptidase M28 [Treponema sp.]|nr:Zn-dependent exopeptidase M28 [Treponema sp.]
MLKSLLDELHFRPQVITLSGNRHFFLSAPEQGPIQCWPPERHKIIILVAHYDRVADSPGANDNSAAVFELIEAALKLREDRVSSWLIIFTDKEELQPGEGIRDQGSYTLAKGLRDIGFRHSRFYIFDACGSGDTLIISTMADYLMRSEQGLGIVKTRYLVGQLRNQALKTVRYLNMDRVRLIPTPFSDDAGFLRAGIAAQTITMLPSGEAAAFCSLVRQKPDFADVLVKREVQQSYNTQLIPATWKHLNGPEDKYHRLTPQYFSQVVRFICALCKG